MGICKRATSVSFDEYTRSLVEKWRTKHQPMLDDSFSAAVRFIVKQYDSFMEVLMSRPDMMLAMVDAQQRLLLHKSSQGFLEFPLLDPQRERGSASDKSVGVRRGTRPLPLDGFLGRKTPNSWAKNWTCESGRPI